MDRQLAFWVFGYIYLIRDWNNLELMEQRMGTIFLDLGFRRKRVFFHCFLYFVFIVWLLRLQE